MDKCHQALINLSEEFRTKQPPDLKSCLQCLLAILNLPVTIQVKARTNYKIGSLIHRYTFDTNIAQTYLEKAYEQAQTPDMAYIRLQVVALLVDIYLAQNQRTLAKQILSRSINETTSGGGPYNLYWHYRFLLRLSHLNLEDGEFGNANSQLSIGAQTAESTNDVFTRTLFLLSKSMVLMIASKYPNTIMQQPQHLQQTSPEQQLGETMTSANNLLETWQSNQTHKESLKVFYLVLQVCNLLHKGHIKTARPWLKSLQQSIQNLTNLSGQDAPPIEETYRISENMSENFIWMPRDHLCILVYLISALHSMQAGSLDKAQNYAERALVQIDRMRQMSQRPDPLLESFHILLLEHMSMCHLVMGSRVTAIKQTAQAIELCYGGSQKLRIRHRGIVRTILGFYAMSMSMIEDAENHFTRVMNDNDLGTELRVMAMFNLALCYLQDDTRRHERRHDVEALLNRLNTEQLNSLSYYLKATAYYVYGLKAFCDVRFNDAKRNLRETLKLANGEDLNRVTSCSLVLLGKIFDNSELPRESLNMVSPALKLAEKIGDFHVQLWASSVLKDIYARDVNSSHYMAAMNKHETFVAQLNNDKLQSASLAEHRYVQWNDW